MNYASIPTLLSLASLTTTLYLLSPRTLTYILRAAFFRLQKSILMTGETICDLYKSMPARNERHLIVHLGDYFFTTVLTVLFLAVAIPIAILLVAATFVVRLLLCWTILPLAPTLANWRRERRDLGRETPVQGWILDWLSVLR